MLESTHEAPQFPATRWTVVLAAAGRGVEAREALEELCRIYWFPLYVFARQHGCSAEDAEDETQDFLARTAAGEILASATPQRGKLRSFLLAAFQHDLLDTCRRRNRQKRGGHLDILSIDSVSAEDRLACATLHATPEANYDRAWAVTCLESALGELAAEYEARGRTTLFAALRSFIDPASDGDCAAAAVLGLNANAQRQAVFRLRQRFRALLRQTVANTLSNPTAEIIDEEIEALPGALSGR